MVNVKLVVSERTHRAIRFAAMKSGMPMNRFYVAAAIVQAKAALGEDLYYELKEPVEKGEVEGAEGQ